MANIAEIFRNRTVKTLLGIIVVAVLFAAVSNSIGLQWRQIEERNLVFADGCILWLGLSMVLTIGSFMVHGASWVWILNILSGRVEYEKGLKIFFLSQLGRYIPGKIWTFMGRFMVCRDNQVTRMAVSESILYELMMSICGACVVFAVTATVSGGAFGHQGHWVQYLIIVAVACFMIWPATFVSALNLVLQKIKLGQIQSVITSMDLLKYLFMHIAVWLLMGYGFYCMARSFIVLPMSLSIYFPALFCLAWLGGFFSILTPAGIGVREGILTYLLAQYVSAADALVIALFSRLWVTAAEIISVGIAVGISYLYAIRHHARNRCDSSQSVS